MIVTYVRDLSRPVGLSAETRARMAAMTEAEIQANAESDPDNPPMTEAEFEALTRAGALPHAAE